MKKIFSIMMMAAAVLATVGCQKTTEGLTRTTYYPVIEILGSNPAISVLGSTYSDAGCKATLNGDDITDQVTVASNVNTNALGIYSVSYSAVNKDGFSAVERRSVYVANPGNFDNLYFGESEFGSRHYYDAPVMIKKLADGTYLIDDVLAGFYWNGRYPGYEPTYDFHAEAVLQLNDDNTITLLEVGDWYFGEPGLIEFTSATYDPEGGVIEIEINFDGDPFYVTLVDVTK